MTFGINWPADAMSPGMWSSWPSMTRRDWSTRMSRWCSGVPTLPERLRSMRQAGVKVIGLDFLFSVSAESWLKRLNLPESDQSRNYDLPFREQLASGQVILAGDLAIDAEGKEKPLLPLPDYWASLPEKLDDVGSVKFYRRP